MRERALPPFCLSAPNAELWHSAVSVTWSALLVSPLYVAGLVPMLAAARQRPLPLALSLASPLLLLGAPAFGIELPGAFAEALLIGAALLFLRRSRSVGQLDLALVAVLQIAIGLARASGQV